ncbi:hypothetical protein M3661_29485 [Paenibacillus sp. MER 180]|uniref:hypothetical protein n=1 Tax=Paenibacillus sp. MER 180 TaxID=2939570 RepID=UPI00203A6262|nr:hypothetical protein [Paenibacillus sp. MER 180]MCM3294222.1 hypothetical protein [Paenibacillus sp. MER 180]
MCEGCIYNRPVYAWGEVIENACWYRHDTKKELYGKADDESYCSGKTTEDGESVER